MTAPSAPPDEYTLLCERCGYIIEGLPTDNSCPECNRPIALSLPERRTGTPWQQRSTPRSLVQTWWQTARHPLRTMDTLRIHEMSLLGMVVPTLLMCGVVWWLIACLLETPTTQQLNLLAGPIFFFAFATFVSAIGLLLLSCVFAVGLQCISRIRGTRITPDTAWHIVGLASIGWVLTYAIWLGGWSAVRIWRIIDPPIFDYQLRQRVFFELDNILMPTLLGGFVAGFTVFLAYAILGFNRLRYANQPRPDAPTPPTPVAAHAARD
jgi:hypothetical protein